MKLSVKVWITLNSIGDFAILLSEKDEQPGGPESERIEPQAKDILAMALASLETFFLPLLAIAGVIALVAFLLALRP